MADEINININILLVIGSTGEPEEIRLTAVEAAIVKYCQKHASYCRLDDLYSWLSNYSRPEIYSAASNLCTKKILQKDNYGYYTLNESMNCRFVADKEVKKLAPQKTDEEKRKKERKQESDAVRNEWSAAKKEGEKRTKEFQAELEQEVERKKEEVIRDAKQQLSKQTEEAAAELASLGLFAFQDKQACKKKIKKLQYDLEHIEQSDLVILGIKKLQTLAERRISEYNKQIADYLSMRYHVETETATINPLDFYNCVSGNDKHDKINREILTQLRSGSCSINELQEKSSMLGGESTTTIRALITRLQKYDLVEWDFNQPDGNSYKVKLKQSFYEKKTEYWTENPKMEDVPLPAAPSASAALK